MYEFIAHYYFNGTQQILLTDGEEPRKCRFCGKGKPDVKFKKMAHAISHMVGNRVLKSTYECDSCNALFSKYESEYSNYMNFYHTMFHVEGKGGTPKYKRRPNDFSNIEALDKNISIQLRQGEESLIEWGDLEKKLKRIKIKGKRSYIPEYVLKAVIKMAISIAPKEEMPFLKDTIEWLMGEKKEGKLPELFIRIYEKPALQPYCCLLKKTSRYYLLRPSYFFVLAYSNLVIQVPIPFVFNDRTERPQVLRYPYYPAIQDMKNTKYSKGMINLSGKEKVKGEDVWMTVSYSHVEGKDLSVEEKDSSDIPPALS